MRRTRAGSARGTVRMSGWGAAIVDLDNDGFKDIVTANSHANDRIEEFESTTYRQTNGRLPERDRQNSRTCRPRAGPDFAVARAHRGIGIGDFDGDGRLDLVVTVLGDRAQLLRNVSEPGEPLDDAASAGREKRARWHRRARETRARSQMR